MAVISAIDSYRQRYALFCLVYLITALLNFTLQTAFIVILLVLFRKVRLEIAI